MFKNYLNAILEVSEDLNEDILNNAIKTIKKTIKNQKKIFVCGNGGSASLSDHALCDWTKRLYPKKNVKYMT